MLRARLRTLLTITAIIAAMPASPGGAYGQSVLTRIKEKAAKRVEERKAKLDTAVMNTASGAVDSTLEKTGRGAEDVVTKAGTVVDTALNRTERGISSLVSRDDDAERDALSTELATGRAVVRGIDFAPGSSQLLPSSASALARLARIIQAASGPYLIEAHTDSVGEAAAKKVLSERRAAAVKAALAAAGVPESRLFAMGFGGTRPLPSSGRGVGGASERIEVARMQ